MSDTTFGRVTVDSPSDPTVSEFKENKVGASYDLPDIEPVTEQNVSSVVLKTLGVDDDIHNMPHEDVENLNEVTRMLGDLVKDKGLKAVRASYDKVLKEVMVDVGLDELSDPTAALQRLGTLIKAYKSLAFIKSGEERRRIFMKLGRLSTTKEIDQAVMATIERSNIWR